MNELEKYHLELERREALEHRDVLLAINQIVQTPEGQKLFSYLFKNFEVGVLPPRGMKDEDLADYLGFLRAGNSIFKLTSEANSEFAGSTLAKIERKRYEDIREQHAIEHGLKQTDSDT